MTDIRELLREATADVTIERSDPVRQVRRATTRRRRTAAAVGLAVVAVAAAIVVPVSLSPSSRNQAPVNTGQPAVRDQWPSNDGDVAGGFGFIWGVKCCGNEPRSSFIERLDPASGTQLEKISIPGPAAQIATGVGRVWVLGASDAGISAVSAYDPTTTKLSSIRSRSFAPDDIAFSHGSAWVTMGGLGQIWRLTPTSHGIQKSVLAAPGFPEEIVATGNGTLWVERRVHGVGSGRCASCALTRIVATRSSARLGRSVPWAGDVFIAAGPTQLWASIGHTMLRLAPALLNKCSACAQDGDRVVSGQQISWIAATPRGLFVATYGSPAAHNITNFYSDANLAGSRSKPSARLITDSGPLAPDGDGVVIAAEDPGLVHWVPAG